MGTEREVRAPSTAESEGEEWTPTKKAHYCNQAGPMGGGCKDSWHVGGNYGSHVCRNPNHHAPALPETEEEG